MGIPDFELSAQRQATRWFLWSDAFRLVLYRDVRASDGSGGTTTTKTPISPQPARLAPLQDATSDRVASDGRVLKPGYMLIGDHTLDVQRQDTFVKDGRRYEVVFVLENRQYQVKAEVAYLG